jgi:primase-polymerase (primpol)-like protein
VTAAVIESATTSIPEELLDLERWVTWKYVPRGNGKPGKTSNQKVNDSTEWHSYDEAVATQPPSNKGGIGYVLTDGRAQGDGYVGLDLDYVLDEAGEVVPEDAELVQDVLALKSYAEYSPSGRGIHVIMRGVVTGDRSRVGKLEIYGEGGHGGRYFTVTGKPFGTATEIASGPEAQARLDALVAKRFQPELPNVAPRAIKLETTVSTLPAALPEAAVEPMTAELTNEDILQKLFGQKDGARWADLYQNEGAWRRYPEYKSQSQADFAFLQKLRYYAGKNADKINELFRGSALMRPKWDSKRGTQTLGEKQIDKIISQGGHVYTPRREEERMSKLMEHERTCPPVLETWWIKRLRPYGSNVLAVLAAIASYPDGHPLNGRTIAYHADLPDTSHVWEPLGIIQSEGILKRQSGPNKRTANRYHLVRDISALHGTVIGDISAPHGTPIYTGWGVAGRLAFPRIPK